MVRTVEMSAATIGIALALGSVTVMAGAALTPLLARRIGSARITWVSLAVTGPVAMLAPLAQPGWLALVVVVSMAVGELGQIVYAVTNLSLRQQLCPERLLGRVNATMRFVMMGLFPVGALLGGVMGELVGTRATLWLVGGIIALSPLPLYQALRGIRDVSEIPPWSAGAQRPRSTR
jgi:MFS family permease